METYKGCPNRRLLSTGAARAAQRHRPSVRKRKSPTARRRRRASFCTLDARDYRRMLTFISNPNPISIVSTLLPP